MNVLFYTTFEVSEQKGGTERITSRIAKELQNRYNVNCYSIYSVPIDSRFERTQFLHSEQISLTKNHNRLNFLIKQYQINIIINQGAFHLTSFFYEIKKTNPKIKLILVHHFNPGAEINFISFRDSFLRWEYNKFSIKNIKNIISFPYQKIKRILCLPQRYREAYMKVDKVVLLSNNFKKEFINFARIQNEEKLTFIHNALSFDSFLNIQDLQFKKKYVLIVSRLEDTQKRISLALKVWKYVEQDPELQEWTLKIVGHGIYEKKYKEYVRRHNLQRVLFEGIQKPEKYYQEASIFMMTSAFEGWGLTLTEAQQFGCVPIAFNSYSSLTDIITDSKSGYIIPNNQIKEYVKKLTYLMKNRNIREQLAINSINSCKQFSIENIGYEWMKLLNNLNQKNE